MPRVSRTYVCSYCKKTGTHAGRFKQVGKWVVGRPVDHHQSVDDPSAPKHKPTDRYCKDCAEKLIWRWLPLTCRGLDGNSCGSKELKCDSRTGLPIRFGDGSSSLYFCGRCAKDFGRCPHGRVRSQCKECGGSQICEHGRRKYGCKDCCAARDAAARTLQPPVHPKPEILVECEDVEDPGEEDEHT